VISTSKLDKLLEVHIFMAKKGQTFKKYSPDFKLSVILDMRNNHLSYAETVRKYWLTTTASAVSFFMPTSRGFGYHSKHSRVIISRQRAYPSPFLYQKK
jgi:hypothetical protein